MAKANVGTSADGLTTVITLEVPKSEAAKIVDRWTWSEMNISFQSGREKFDVTFPKLKEQRDERRLGR